MGEIFHINKQTKSLLLLLLSIGKSVGFFLCTPSGHGKHPVPYPSENKLSSSVVLSYSTNKSFTHGLSSIPAITEAVQSVSLTQNDELTDHMTVTTWISQSVGMPPLGRQRDIPLLMTVNLFTDPWPLDPSGKCVHLLWSEKQRHAAACKWEFEETIKVPKVILSFLFEFGYPENQREGQQLILSVSPTPSLSECSPLWLLKI